MNTPEQIQSLQSSTTTADNYIDNNNKYDKQLCSSTVTTSNQQQWESIPGNRPWSSIQRWLWENTSNEKSVSQSYVLNQETFYFVRQVCFAISAITWTMSQVDSSDAILTNFQYLTEWGVDLTVIYFALTLRIMKNYKFAEKYWKMAHGIFEVCYSVEFIITAMYWAAIYPTITREKNAYYLVLTTLEHGGMFILLIIDKTVNQIKFYKRHLIYLAAFMIVYLTVNLAVTLCFSPVYSIIDWNTRESHIFTLVALLATLLHFCSARIIYDIFKKHKVEKAATVADDYFFTPHPLNIDHFNKYLNNRYVWWALLITVVLIVSSAFTSSLM